LVFIASLYLKVALVDKNAYENVIAGCRCTECCIKVSFNPLLGTLSVA